MEFLKQLLQIMRNLSNKKKQYNTNKDLVKDMKELKMLMMKEFKN